MTITPTPEQAAIVDFAKNRKESLLVNALAGSSKTTTLVMCAHAMSLVPTLSLAFNKKIATEMQTRMPSHIQCSTLNSIGHRVWAASVGHRLNLDTDKSYRILSDLVKQLRPEERESVGEAFASMLRAMRLAKSAGYIPKKFEHLGKVLTSREDFEAGALASCDIEPDQQFWSLVDEALCLGIAEGFQGTIDFDDQLYLSCLFGGNFPKYPTLLVDESQDLSPLNHAMVEKMFAGRLIAVGDRNQAIYGFRGAHTSSMEVMRDQFSMEELTLSISFRCPKAVILRARSRAPNMQWPEWAIEGKVSHLESWTPQTPPDGSAVICRNNAPLFRTAMAFIKSGRGVKILGNDIGAGLIRLLKKLGKPEDSQETLIKSINSWRQEQIDKASKSRIGPINDRADCLLVFAEQGKNLKEAILFAEHLFSASGPVEFMTGHKAKGLERKHVYYLDAFLIPSKWARAASEQGDDSILEQELNLNYVIQTRAQESLTYVNSEDLIP